MHFPCFIIEINSRLRRTLNNSTFQFRRVLSILSLIADEVEFHALEKQYKVNVGGMNVFNYLAFCDDVYELAKLNKLDWRDIILLYVDW